MFKSIRHGLFAALAGFTVLICVVYTGLALVISYVTEDMLVDRLLAREAAAITVHFARHGSVQPPGNDLIRIHGDAEGLPPSVREQVMAGRLRAEVFTDTGRHYHVRTLDLNDGSGPQRFYLLADVGPLLVVSQLFRDVGGMLTLVALGLIGLALLLAYWLSRRLVTPLQLLADEVRDGSTAFTAQRRRDEIGYLAERLGTTMAALHAALAREHAFTRDVSHELRTPLTVMNNALGQAASRPLQGHEVAQLQAGLADIGNIIDVLFALARAEHIAREVLDLRGCIEDCLLRLSGDAGWHAARLALDVPDRLAVTGNRHLAMLLLNNCLGNAVFHGGPDSQLRISYADGVLRVANSVDADRPGTMHGFLHGQNLLRRVAGAMDWGLAFEAGAASYCVTIVPVPAR